MMIVQCGRVKSGAPHGWGAWLWEYVLDYENMALTMRVWSCLWEYGLDYESMVLTMRVWSWLWEYGLDYESMVFTMREWSWLWEYKNFSTLYYFISERKKMEYQPLFCPTGPTNTVSAWIGWSANDELLTTGWLESKSEPFQKNVL